jgi:dihydrofolate synthase/folylpolyglutamate synthase
LNIIGPALKDVAYEKAGIIKAGAAFLNGETNRKWRKIFENELKKVGTRNARAKGADYEELKNIKISLDGTQFEYKGGKYNLKLLGGHQARNAALAIECAKDLKISEMAIRDGLLGAFYAARMEIISREPLIIIDGAHNEDKLKAALKFLNAAACAPRARRYLIMAMAKDKKTKILPEFFKYFDKIYFTRFSNPFRKCLTFGDWRKIAMKVSKNKIKYRHMPQDALLDILPKLGNNDLLLITGSIFLAGELRGRWYSEDKILKSKKSFFKDSAKA